MPPKPTTAKGEVYVSANPRSNRLEVVVPAGLSHKALAKVNLADLLSKFRPKGCQACLSGQDFLIRERFEKVLPIDISEAGFKM